MEGEGRWCGGDVVRGGAGSVCLGCDEDVDRKRGAVGEYELRKLHHGNKVTDGGAWKQNNGWLRHDLDYSDVSLSFYMVLQFLGVSWLLESCY